jgi:hypothetical protein
LINAEFHFAVGDAVSWSGIKRVGNAFVMGQFVATNIMLQMISGAPGHSFQSDVDLVKCPPMKPMMALSIGETALVYRGDDTGSWTEEVQEVVVGRGLGIDREF